MIILFLDLYRPTVFLNILLCMMKSMFYLLAVDAVLVDALPILEVLLDDVEPLLEEVGSSDDDGDESPDVVVTSSYVV